MDVFVDGVFIGSGGNGQRHETVFELRKSFSLPDDSVRSGEIEIAVRAFDWYGAGGIFRPVSLTTRPIRPGTPILVPPDASPDPEAPTLKPPTSKPGPKPEALRLAGGGVRTRSGSLPDERNPYR